MNEFEQRLSEALHQRAGTARPHHLSTPSVVARVEVRRRHRQRRLAVASGVTAAVLVGAMAASLPLLRHGASTPSGDGGSRAAGAATSTPARSATTAGPVLAPAVASTIVGFDLPVPTTSANATAPQTVGWDHLIGTTAEGWRLSSAVAWSRLRTSGWPTPYLRTATWSNGERGADGRYLVVQSQIDPATLAHAGPLVPLDNPPGGRQLVEQATDSLVTVSWTETVAERGQWTMAIRGWRVDEAVVVEAARSAVWDDSAERWNLGLTNGWSLESWPNTGDPREVVLQYANDADGATFRVAVADTPGRFGADLVTFSQLDGAHTTVDVGGRVGYAQRSNGSASWQVTWPETDRLVARVEGPAGVSLADTVRMVARIDPSSIAIATGS